MEPTTDRSTNVNLLLNEERWTGYNGSHVWDMIYSENCFSGHQPTPADAETPGIPFANSKHKPKSLQELCYEERVHLYNFCVYEEKRWIHINEL